MVDKAKQRTTISILLSTKDALDLMKHRGQSYDGVIQELVEFREEKRKKYGTRRKEQTSTSKKSNRDG